MIGIHLRIRQRQNRYFLHQHAKLSFVRAIKGFIEEWKEMQKASQPMPNPPDMIPTRGWRDYIKLSLRDHWTALSSTVNIYKLTHSDRDEAIRLLKIDAELTRQIIKNQNEKKQQQQQNTVDINVEPHPSTSTDVAELTERVKKMFPKEISEVKTLEDAARVAMDKRGDIQEIIVDRLEVLGQAISEFMSGYREGKEASLREVAESKDLYIDRLMDPLSPKSNEGLSAPIASPKATQNQNAKEVKPAASQEGR